MHKALVTFVILGCGWLFSSTASAEEPAGKTVEFTVLHLNDVYEIERPGKINLSAGLARVARMRKTLVEENPRTYTVLSGDALSPSPLASAIIEGDELAGRQMVAVLNVMGLDFATFGNHEFDLSKDQLRKRLMESTFTWISSNITDAVGRALPGVPSDVILEVRDAGELVRVGLIGLTIDSTRPDYVRFLDPVAVAREKVRRLRGSCDVIIALTHLAIEEDRKVAAAVPEIHLILGGHEHQSSFECRATAQRYSAPIAKADSNAKTVTVHRLSFNTRTRHLTIRSRLVPVSVETDPQTGAVRDDVDARTDRLARYWKKRGFDALKETFGRDPSEIVAHSDVVLDGLDSSVRFRPTNLTDLIAEAMLASAPGARGAIFNSGSIRIDDVLDQGDISVYDVYRVLPYPGNVVRAVLEGSLLLDLLNKGVTIPDEGGFLQTAGIGRTPDGHWQIGGEPIKSGELYPIAIAEYLLRGRELIYGDVRKPETINARLNLVWDSLSAAKKEPPTRPGTPDLDIRDIVMRYMTTNERGRITIPPKSAGDKRPLPSHAVDWPVVNLDVDPTVKASSQFCHLPLAALLTTALSTGDEPPNAAALIERYNREKSPVWADGDTATFFFRGAADKVDLIAGGDIKSLERIPSSDVWTVALKLPGLERAVLSYHLTATSAASPKNQTSRHEGVWRGPKAPPRVVEAAERRGSIKTVEIESQALAARRKLTVYVPPDLLPGKATQVVYSTDGEEIERYANVLEPLIGAAKVPPIVLIGVHSAGYLGGGPDSKGYDTKKDLRAQEYFPGLNPERFARHESFFCSEVSSWAERECNVSRQAKDRILFGCSNGARFVFEMAIRHPDRFRSVLAFSVPGGGPIMLPDRFKTQTRFFLEAGTWEQHFQVYTSRLAERLKQSGVAVELSSRVGGHDKAIWREEFAKALLSAFGSH